MPSSRRFVRLKLIVTAALLKPPYRCLGFVQSKDIQRESNALTYRRLGIVHLNSAFFLHQPYTVAKRRTLSVLLISFSYISDKLLYSPKLRGLIVTKPGTAVVGKPQVKLLPKLFSAVTALRPVHR